MSAPAGLLATANAGKKARALRALVYGVEGIGKSSFPRQAPAPLYLDADDGTAQLDVTRIRVTAWTQLEQIIGELTSRQHPYRTIVLDTIDALERLLIARLCAEADVASIEAVGGGYGKGWTAVGETWTRLLVQLSLLQERGMNVIALAQAEVATFRNPDGSDWQRWNLRCSKKSAAVWKEWVEEMLFATREVAVQRAGPQKGKAQGGRRILYTEWSPGREAKNRRGLPAVLPLDWRAFEAAATGKVTKSLRPAEPGTASPETDEDDATEVPRAAGPAAPAPTNGGTSGAPATPSAAPDLAATFAALADDVEPDNAVRVWAADRGLALCGWDGTPATRLAALERLAAVAREAGCPIGKRAPRRPTAGELRAVFARLEAERSPVEAAPTPKEAADGPF